MVSVGDKSSKAGSRSLNADLNLVPFIDMLSMCICFLLMTAVWIQIGALEVKQSRGTDVEQTSAPLEMDLRFTSPTALEMRLHRGGKGAKKIVFRGATVEAMVNDLEAGLDRAVVASSGAKNFKGDAASLVSSAMLTPLKGVPYGDLITVMDVLRKHRIVNLGVVPVGG